MTCKDCFHFEVCDSGRHIGEYIDDDGIYSDGVEKECPTFKSKAAYERAMGKLTPKKPILDTIFPSGVKWFMCAACNHNNVEKNDPFCHQCGQALDWSDTE